MSFFFLSFLILNLTCWVEMIHHSFLVKGFLFCQMNFGMNFREESDSFALHRTHFVNPCIIRPWNQNSYFWSRKTSGGQYLQAPSPLHTTNLTRSFDGFNISIKRKRQMVTKAHFCPLVISFLWYENTQKWMKFKNQNALSCRAKNYF